MNQGTAQCRIPEPSATYRFFRRFLLIRIGFRAMPCRNTLRGTNISPPKGIFEVDFPLPMVGYVISLEGNPWILISE